MRWRALRPMQFFRSVSARAGGPAGHDVVATGDEGDNVDQADMEEDDRRGFERAKDKIMRADPQARVVAVDFGNGRPRTMRVGSDVAAAIDTEGAGSARVARTARGGSDGEHRDPRRRREPR